LLAICVSLAVPALSQPLTAIGNNGTAKWNDNFLAVSNGELVVGDSVVYLKGMNFEPTTQWDRGWSWWTDPADTCYKYMDQQFAFLSDTLLGDVNIVRTMLNDSSVSTTANPDILVKADSFLTKAARKGIKVVFNICADSLTDSSPWNSPYNLVYGKRGDRPWNTSKNFILNFKNDERVAWWEFKNEISNALFAIGYADAAKDTIYHCVKRWVDSVKANDTNHLVAGFNEDLFHTSHYEKADGHDISMTNDLLPTHDYGEPSFSYLRPADPGDTDIFYTAGSVWQVSDWLKKERLFGLPVVVGETGYSSGDNPPLKRNLERHRDFVDQKLRAYNKDNVKGVLFWSIRDGRGVADTHVGSKGGLIMQDSTYAQIGGRKPVFFLWRSWSLPDGEKRQAITAPLIIEPAYPGLPPSNYDKLNESGNFNFFLNGDFRHWCAGVDALPSGFDWSFGESNCRVTREDTLTLVGLHSMRIAATAANGGVRQSIKEHISEQPFASAANLSSRHLGLREYFKSKWVTMSGWFMAAPTNRGYSIIGIGDGTTTSSDSLDYKGRWEYKVITKMIDSRNVDTGTTENALLTSFTLSAAGDSMYCSGISFVEGREPKLFQNNPRDFIIHHIASPVMDLGGPDVTYRLFANPGDLQYGYPGQNDFSTSVSERRKWKGIKAVVVQYVEATSADAGVAIRLGHIGHGGIGSPTAFFSVTSATSQAAGNMVDLTSSMTAGQLGSLAGNLNLTCGTAGLKIGTGAVQLHVYLLDYN